ncbi:MAG: Gamma-glutamyl-hercynylcysteine sulfoxide hydrolase [Acidimicrobiales bacterium]|nr:MAG: ergothioneine biosynthesis protein EgtC [Actinomycetota bacterium]MBV6507414.1 Gamma-glutamyl-hercynylcysteine sulfoxide hydrolase [Acidimicrobiales bacterium]RIK07798.1 MAG: ergothioneine biosynthesis protein EgtC [Acidobacteriota bacterium]
MCRLLGYMGPPATLHELLYTPPFGLLRQSWEPREQRHGTVNADGWGVGWYAPGIREAPARYRTARPMWADTAFESVAGVVETSIAVAGVRSATPPAPIEESGAPPFVHERVLFAHNGAVAGFGEGVGTKLRRSLSETREGGIEGGSDSEVLFAMVLDSLDEGLGLAQALRQMADRVLGLTEARLNAVASDGETVIGLACGDTLYSVERPSEEGVRRFVVSEPFDDDPDWIRVPDRSIVTLDRGSLVSGPFDATGQ